MANAKAKNAKAGSPEAQLDAFRNAKMTVTVPEGLTLATRQHEIVWEQFTASRVLEDWNMLDLVHLHKAVLIEVKIRKLESDMQKEMDEAENFEPNSTVFNIQSNLINQQIGILKTLGLFATSSGPGAIRAKADAKDKAKKSIKKNTPKKNKNNVASLLS